MGEGIKNIAVLLWFAFAFNAQAKAQTSQAIVEENPQVPTEVMAVAKTSDGKDDVFVIKQPAGAANPLGDPIVSTDKINNTGASESIENVVAQTKPKENSEVNNEEEKGVVPPSAAQILGNDFQDTLEEANGRIYDIQSYPAADIPVIEDSANPETIYSPNVNP